MHDENGMGGDICRAHARLVLMELEALMDMLHLCTKRSVEAWEALQWTRGSGPPMRFGRGFVLESRAVLCSPVVVVDNPSKSRYGRNENRRGSAGGWATE